MLTVVILCLNIIPAKVFAQDIFSPIVKDTSELKPLLKTIPLTDTSAVPLLSIDSIFNEKIIKYDLKNEIRNLIVIPNQRKISDELPYPTNYTNAVTQFLPFENKTIRNIEFQQLEVLGQNIFNLMEKPDNWFEKIINELHIKTQKSILENNMLLRKGDKIDPAVLADNERLIRKMPGIQDARIIPQNVENTSDSVDVLIITKDLLPVGFGVELFDMESGQMGVWSQNLLGIGHEIHYNLQWDITKSPQYGHKVQYKINNIGNSFFSSDASYEHNWNTKSTKIYLTREFFTPEIKWAGGIGYEDNKLLKDIHIIDTVYIDQPIEYKYRESWFGHSLRFFDMKNKLSRRTVAIIGRVYNYHYYERPLNVNETNLHNFHSRTTILGSISINKQAYIKSRFIYKFWNLEDIPYGSRYIIIGGYELGEFSNRYYSGINISNGYYIRKLGYLYQNTEIGGFYNSKLEQAVINVTLKYFTPLLNPNGGYRYRVFANVNYIRGINRNRDEYIELSTNEGIRGLSSESLQGNERLFLNFEGTCYSPHKLYGFRFTYFCYFDCGTISYNNNLLSQPFYTGFGIGAKIRNENLVFNTILIRFGYYPLLPDPYRARYYEFSGISIYDFPSFKNIKPEITKFQN